MKGNDVILDKGEVHKDFLSSAGELNNAFVHSAFMTGGCLLKCGGFCGDSDGLHYFLSMHSK